AVVGANTIKFWEVPTGKERATIKDRDGTSDGIAVIAYSPDGKTLVTAGTGTAVNLWDVATQKLRTSFKVRSAGIYSLAFSPNGKLLACGSDMGKVTIWNLKTKRQLETFKDRQSQNAEGACQLVLSLAFSPDGRWLVSAPYDGPALI